MLIRLPVATAFTAAAAAAAAALEDLENIFASATMNNCP